MSRTWVPMASEEHILWDVILENGRVVGSVERFTEDQVSCAATRQKALARG